MNKGYKFVANQGSGSGTYILGSTIKIVPGAVDTGYLGNNLKTEAKEGSTTAKFEIGLSDTPAFTNVTVSGNPSKGHMLLIRIMLIIN